MQKEEAEHPLFFGFGSLVNLNTHNYLNPKPAHLDGWRRIWRHTTRPVAFLSARRCPGARIAGVVAQVPGGDWEALDEREVLYARQDVSDAVHHDGPRGKTAVYEVEEKYFVDVSEGSSEQQRHILLSYLDVVVQGFARVHGKEAVTAFFETTEGWDTTFVLNDRDDPQYPRSQQLTTEESALVDEHLAKYNVRVSNSIS
eukprot:m.71586 g.71586  ORF g.71586 m.71586 type:complete len:200 (-) comp12262_c0_seq1:132-731(-)